MAAPISISRRDLAREPHAVWNAFVDLAHRPAEVLDEIQRTAHYAFLYEGEVQNGGHLQFLENAGVEAVPLVRAALEALGAHAHARILAEALEIRTTHGTPVIETAQEFVDAAREGLYDACDEAFYGCAPDLIAVLGRFLDLNRDAFVRVEV